MCPATTPARSWRYLERSRPALPARPRHRRLLSQRFRPTTTVAARRRWSRRDVERGAARDAAPPVFVRVLQACRPDAALATVDERRRSCSGSNSSPTRMRCWRSRTRRRRARAAADRRRLLRRRAGPQPSCVLASRAQTDPEGADDLRGGDSTTTTPEIAPWLQAVARAPAAASRRRVSHRVLRQPGAEDLQGRRSFLRRRLVR